MSTQNVEMADARARDAEQRLQASQASHAEATSALKHQIHSLQQRLHALERETAKVAVSSHCRRSPSVLLCALLD
jgi:predicted  nucleic acid-binding Zn-ribbon protein